MNWYIELYQGIQNDKPIPFGMRWKMDWEGGRTYIFIVQGFGFVKMGASMTRHDDKKKISVTTTTKARVRPAAPSSNKVAQPSLCLHRADLLQMHATTHEAPPDCGLPQCPIINPFCHHRYLYSRHSNTTFIAYSPSKLTHSINFIENSHCLLFRNHWLLQQICSQGLTNATWISSTLQLKMPSIPATKP